MDFGDSSATHVQTRGTRWQKGCFLYVEYLLFIWFWSEWFGGKISFLGHGLFESKFHLVFAI